ncbi:hypothetical protein [Mediterranea massiliensis]|uniref:hypothetical protein n=1 Tax=Mediterranea massiliensis TaxID=1841865 RepID=UPI0025A4BF50|nr:hypothetical protein [Mediterranea massiliensis]MDM8336081.1 hypothetical protein [Mediterranea massiliensis]
MNDLTSTAFAAIAVQLGSPVLANDPAAHTDTAYMDSLVLEYPLPMNATHAETSPFIWISLIVLVAIGIYLACKIKQHRRLAQAQEETQTRQITMLLQREQTFHEQEQVLLKEKEEMTEHLNLAHKERQRLFHSLLEKSKPYQQVLLLLKEHNDGLNANELLSAELWQELTDCINQCAPDFSQRLHKLYPQLDQKDIHFCLLVKAGFKYTAIACLLGRTPNMMYKRRQLIIGRMGKSMSAEQFETYIQAL